MDEQTAVLEAPAAKTLAALQADIEAKQAESNELRATYEELWPKRRELDDMAYLRLLRTEDRLGLLAQEILALEARLPLAALTEGTAAARQQHDDGIPQSYALAERALQATAHLAALLAALADAFQQQVDKFHVFRDVRGQQAFPVEDGRTYARQLFAAYFPQDPRATEAFELLLSNPPTHGRYEEALASSPRFRPFSTIVIQSYLKTMREGMTHDTPE
jgi:hypothetical protein